VKQVFGCHLLGRDVLETHFDTLSNLCRNLLSLHPDHLLVILGSPHPLVHLLSEPHIAAAHVHDLVLQPPHHSCGVPHPVIEDVGPELPWQERLIVCIKVALIDILLDVLWQAVFLLAGF
jgi:hypothetical protein